MRGSGWLADALRVRRWVEEAIRSGGLPDRDPPLDASSETWDVVLVSEGCAAELQRALGGREVAGVPAELLRQRALEEVQNWLSVAGQLRTLDELLSSHSLEAVILKGGRHVAAGGPPMAWLSDLDLLAPPGRAADLARLLDDLEYRSAQRGPAHHEAQRTVSGHVPVEVHERMLAVRLGVPPFDPWQVAVTGEGFRAFRVLPRPEHAWMVLVHGTGSHPARRGSLRDLVLMLPEVRAMGAEERRRMAHLLEDSSSGVAAWQWRVWNGGAAITAEDERLLLVAAALRYQANRKLRGRLSRGLAISSLGRASDRVFSRHMGVPARAPRARARHLLLAPYIWIRSRFMQRAAERAWRRLAR